VLRVRRRLALCLVFCVLPACGTGVATSPSAGPASPGAPTSPPLGTSVSAGTFSTVVPQGWTNTLGNATEVQKLSTEGRVVYLVEQGPPGQAQPTINDVRANINVVVLTQMVPDDQITGYLNSVVNDGATNLSQTRQVILDGATVEDITYDRDIQGTPGESRDLVVNHGGNTYHIVLNTSQFAFNQQLAGLQAVLAAWKWSPS
jgi:hypothetical protein